MNYGFSVQDLIANTFKLIQQYWEFVLLFFVWVVGKLLLDLLVQAIRPPKRGRRGSGGRSSPSSSGGVKRRNQYDFNVGNYSPGQKKQVQQLYEEKRTEFVSSLGRVRSDTPEFHRRRFDFEVQMNRQGLQAWRTKNEYDGLLTRLRQAKSSNQGVSRRRN